MAAPGTLLYLHAELKRVERKVFSDGKRYFAARLDCSTHSAMEGYIIDMCAGIANT
jgi:hypothetical protein